jgi:hypothetical protein
MEQSTFVQAPTEKIYQSNTIRVATFIGGPLVAGYLMSENFKTFNETEKARKAIIYSIVATVVVFGAAFLIPGLDRGGRYIIPLAYTWTAYYLVTHYQGENISSHIKAGGQVYNWWRTLGIGLVGLVVTLIVVFSIVYFTDVATSTETTKTYGVMSNELHFDKSNISDAEVNKIADGLTKIAFFDDKIKKYAYVKKVGASYEISISCNKTIKDNADAIAFFDQLRSNMQKLYPVNKIVFNLVVDDLDNVVKRLE